jgi:hypothetical protein
MAISIVFLFFHRQSAIKEDGGMGNVGEKSKNMENKWTSGQSMNNISSTSLDP